MSSVILSGGFDDLRPRDVRLMEEAAKLGPVHLLLWPDDALRADSGKEPKFPEDERLYLLRAIRYLDRVTLVDPPINPHGLPAAFHSEGDTWAVDEADDAPEKKSFCKEHGLQHHTIREVDLQGFPVIEPDASPDGTKKVIVTGCYDWFHSGHVRFFEEASELGDLYVVVGHDANIELLKGKGHPLCPEDERRYMVQSIRFVKQGLISTGNGWLDAEPEMERIRPDYYVVNEDGDKPEKREYCQAHGIEYRVLRRTPKERPPETIEHRPPRVLSPPQRRSLIPGRNLVVFAQTLQLLLQLRNAFTLLGVVVDAPHLLRVFRKIVHLPLFPARHVQPIEADQLEPLGRNALVLSCTRVPSRVLVVMVVERAAPVLRRLPLQKRHQAAALHVLRDRHPGDVQKRLRPVDVLNQVLVPRPRLNHSRPPHQQRRAERLLVHKTLVKPTVLAEIKTLVRRVHHHRVSYRALSS